MRSAFHFNARNTRTRRVSARDSNTRINPGNYRDVTTSKSNRVFYPSTREFKRKEGKERENESQSIRTDRKKKKKGKEEENHGQDTPVSRMGKDRKYQRRGRDQVNFHFIQREQSIIRHSRLFLDIKSREQRAPVAKSTSFGAAPAGIYICTSAWQLNYLCGVIGSESWRGGRQRRGEREGRRKRIEDRIFSPLHPITMPEEAGAIREVMEW